MSVRFSRKFTKQYRKANSKIRAAFDERLKLFLEDPHHILLNNHQLIGKLKNYRSINITGDWRAIYSSRNKTIIFEVLGTHSQLYK